MAATPPPPQPHHHQQLNHLLSDVPLEATPPPPRTAPTLQLLSTPSGHSTLSPFALSDAGIYMGDDTRDFILRQQSIWLQTAATHSRPPVIAPDDLSSDTNFPLDDDSEDDFKLNPCGESRFHRRQRNRTARQRAEKQAARVLQEDNTQGHHLTAAQRVVIEQKRNTRLKTMDRIKLNLRLGLLLRILELVVADYLGFRYSVESWILYGMQMFLNSCSSCCLLWRFAGKYALPEDTVGCEMCKNLRLREKRCIMWQAIFKFLSATLTLSLAIVGIRAASPGDDLEGYYGPAMTTLGLSIVSSACRGLLNGWGIWLMQEARELQSVVSDLLFSWLAMWSSLQNVGVCGALIAFREDMKRQAEILKISDYIQFAWCGACLLLAIHDVILYARQRDHEAAVEEEQQLQDVKEC